MRTRIVGSAALKKRDKYKACGKALCTTYALIMASTLVIVDDASQCRLCTSSPDLAGSRGNAAIELRNEACGQCFDKQSKIQSMQKTCTYIIRH
jgi:hypothetical protein